MKQKLFLYFLLILLQNRETHSFRCDRRPYGSMTQASAPDGRFRLTVLETEDAYIPEQVYTIQISNTDDESTFTSFMISAEGDMQQDPQNPRRLLSLFPGEIRPKSQSTTKFSDRCLYSVEQIINSPKTSVEVYWQAPSSGNGCVTLRAMVAENDEIWFEDGAPLTRRICEDMRQPDDVAPTINENCQACNEAKYEVSFTGIWSRNTHPRLYPETDWITKYSDLIGVSHATNYILWSPGTLASDGLKSLAENANSSVLAAEIREAIGDGGIRTIIKGKGHGYRKMSRPTNAIFRVDNVHHLLTTAIAISPSPDWFLGVTRFELCQEDNSWMEERELNLYPWDAGTDSGVSYESSNLVTFPQDAVSRVGMSSYDKNSPFFEIDMKDLHPFGRLHIKLVKLYHRECKDDTAETDQNENTGTEQEENPSEPEEPSRYQNSQLPKVGVEPPLETDPDSPEDCPMTPWSAWHDCEGACIDGKISGYKFRDRYHLVDGVPVGKYDLESKNSRKEKEVSQECKDNYPTLESIECVEDCSTNTDIKAERRKMFSPLVPGSKWLAKKRDVANN